MMRTGGAVRVLLIDSVLLLLASRFVLPVGSRSVYAQEMRAGAAAYGRAWSAATANSSSAFLGNMLSCMRHFGAALQADEKTRKPDAEPDEAAFWNLAIFIAYMQSRVQLVDRYRVPLARSWDDALIRSVRSRPRTGLILEFGVGRGFTARRISQELDRDADNRTIHGFDSFHGLHQVWGGQGSTISRRYPLGRFTLGGFVPKNDLPSRMIVHKGMFSATVPAFVLGKDLDLTERAHGVAFAHVDCDLYSSTFEALASMVCLLKRGTVIAFDEAKGYLEWKSAGEWRAWLELADLFGIGWEGIGHYKMRVGIRILNEVARWHPVCRAFLNT